MNSGEGVDAYFTIGAGSLPLIAGETADDPLSPGDVDHEPSAAAGS